VTAVAPEPAVAVLYTRVDADGEVRGLALEVAVSTTLGIRMPLLDEVMSSRAAGVVVPMPTFWAKEAEANTSDTARSNDPDLIRWMGLKTAKVPQIHTYCQSLLSD